jgi:hypothetical protein
MQNEINTPEKTEAANIINAVMAYFNTGLELRAGSTESVIINALMTYFRDCSDSI